jgi:hypothetical protein
MLFQIFDFRLFHESVPPLAPKYPVGTFRVLRKFTDTFAAVVYCRSVIDTGDKMFTGVNDTGEKLSPVSLLPTDKLLRVSLTQVISSIP